MSKISNHSRCTYLYICTKLNELLDLVLVFLKTFILFYIGNYRYISVHIDVSYSFRYRLKIHIVRESDHNILAVCHGIQLTRYDLLVVLIVILYLSSKIDSVIRIYLSSFNVELFHKSVQFVSIHYRILLVVWRGGNYRPYSLIIRYSEHLCRFPEIIRSILCSR